MLRRTWFVTAMVCLLMVAGSAMAQNQGGGQNGGQGGGFGGQGGGGRRGGGRGGDPAAFMQNRLDQIKQDIAASDDEWKVLQPKVQDVLTAQTEANSGGRGGGRRGGGQGGPGGGGFAGGGQAATTAVARAMQELRTTLDNTAATADQISQKLNNLRDARAKADTNLATARKALKELLTARQEAVMVTLSVLD